VLALGRRRRVVALLGATALAAAFVATAPANPSRRVVHVRGTAYEFNSVHTMLGGASIRVAELPKVRATVRRDGTYDLVVPDGARITPYIVAAGHHTIYLQTFVTAGEDLNNVNFQTPSDAIYTALAALLGVQLDAAGNPKQCVIVSTFSTKNVRDLSYAEFIAYGAHGVAGATASAKPSLPRPVYFNEKVIPDRAQATSSKDGGVIWTGVPSGVYGVSGHSASTRFAGFTATCRPGRVVNANPPWGLHELAGANPARIAAAWQVHGPRTTLRSLDARRVPAGSLIRLRCLGTGCRFAVRTLRAKTSTADLARRLGPRLASLAAGQMLEVAVFSHAYNAEVLRWAVHSRKQPTLISLCVPLGNINPRPVCDA
jgi:hypothetical protein